MYTLEGVNSVASLITAYEKSQKTETHFLICSVFFFFQRQSFFCIYVTTLQLV